MSETRETIDRGEQMRRQDVQARLAALEARVAALEAMNKPQVAYYPKGVNPNGPGYYPKGTSTQRSGRNEPIRQ